MIQRIKLIVCACVVLNSSLLSNRLVWSQNVIIPDDTLGEESSQIDSASETIDRIEGGAVRADNLFHSFQEFNIEEGLSAYFANPAGVENILSRVTGSNPSNIFGTLGVEGEANLFFLNPNGVVFGPNASLDIAGSLTISTANSFEFADSSRFDSRAQQSSPLTVSVPLGLQTGDSANANIESSGALSVGGNITLVADSLQLQGNRVEAGRDIQIVANDLVGSLGAQLRTSSDNGGGNITVDVAETVRFDGVNSEIEESGGVISTVEPNSGGDSGSIRVSANNLELTNGAQIGSGVFGVGNAGNVVIDVAQTVRFDGNDSATNFSSGVFSNIEDGGQGTGGDIEIYASNLEVTNGGQLVSGALGEGEAGDILVRVSKTARLSGNGFSLEFIENGLNEDSTSATDASNLDTNSTDTFTSTIRSNSPDNLTTSIGVVDETDTAFLGINALLPSRASGAYSISASDRGNGGDIRVQAANLEIEDGGQLNASTFGEGDAGDIFIDVLETARFSNSLSSPNGLRSGNTGLFSDTTPLAGGRGGDIAIVANNLELLDGAELRAVSRGTGDAGSISIEANQQVLADNGKIRTVSEAGTGGNVLIEAEDVRLRNDSDITTFVPTGTGNGGNITIAADSVLAFGDSDILSFSIEGNGGDIFIDTPVLLTQNDPLAGDRTPPTELFRNETVDINASGRVSGTISIPDAVRVETAPSNLPEGFENATIIAASSCVSPLSNPNRFVISGRGGVPAQTGSGLSLSYATGIVRSLSTQSDNGENAQVDANQRRSRLSNLPEIFDLNSDRLATTRECFN